MLHTLNRVPEDCKQVIDSIATLRNRLRYSLSDGRRRWTGILRRSTLAKAIQGSNSIEGYNVNYNDAVAAVDGEEPVDAKTKEWINVVGYRTAMTHVLQLTGDPSFRLDEGTIRGMHFMMLTHDMASHPGIWRRGGIFVRRDPGGEVVYEGPDPALVSDLIGELVEWLNDKGELPVMVKAALAHLNLVMIHPFSDGNGRMGRALQTLVLARERIVDPVFSSIEEWLGNHTPEYYEVLGLVGQGSWHPENDPLPFIRYCLKAHFQQAEDLLTQDTMLERIWKSVEAEVKQRKLMGRTAFALADAAIGIKVRNSAYRKAVDISDESASKDFRTLVGEGLLVPQGERKGRHYVAGEILKKIWETAYIPKQERDPFAILEKAKEARIQPELPGFETTSGARSS